MSVLSLVKGLEDVSDPNEHSLSYMSFSTKLVYARLAMESLDSYAMGALGRCSRNQPKEGPFLCDYGGHIIGCMDFNTLLVEEEYL